MDYSWSDPKVIVPIYAAIVATTSLGWNIIKTILDSRRKIIVNVGIRFAWVQQGNTQSPSFVIFDVTITNKSKTKMFVKRPNILLSREINTGLGINKRLSNPFEDIYPKALIEGEELNNDFPSFNTI